MLWTDGENHVNPNLTNSDISAGTARAYSSFRTRSEFALDNPSSPSAGRRHHEERIGTPADTAPTRKTCVLAAHGGLAEDDAVRLRHADPFSNHPATWHATAFVSLLAQTHHHPAKPTPRWTGAASESSHRSVRT